MAFLSQAGNNTGAGQLQTTQGQFIPEVWTSQLVQDIEENLILAASPFTNRQYEGEFRREGDVVRIPHFVDGTVSDKGLVKAYGEIGTADHAALEYMKMTVAKGSSFHLEIDALHQLQTKGGIDLMSNLVAQRGRQTALAIDELVALTLLAALQGKDLNGAEDRAATVSGLPALELGAISTIQGTDVDTPAADAMSVYDYVVKMLEVLDTRSAPQDRYLFVSPRMRSCFCATRSSSTPRSTVAAARSWLRARSAPSSVCRLSWRTRWAATRGPTRRSSRRATRSSRASTCSWARPPLSPSSCRSPRWLRTTRRRPSRRP